jgi:hypothetical protein
MTKTPEDRRASTPKVVTLNSPPAASGLTWRDVDMSSQAIDQRLRDLSELSGLATSLAAAKLIANTRSSDVAGR